VVLDSHGRVLQYDVRDGLRLPVHLEQVAPAVIDATVATEDQRFFEHPGIDPLAIVRSLVRWTDAPSGASTISQQLARGLYLRDEERPVPVRKVREAVLALQLEAHRSKNELLMLYLNQAYYGRGAYGIEAAARTYFGVPAQHLTTAQAALLAGLPQAPALDPKLRTTDPAKIAQPEAERQKDGPVQTRGRFWAPWYPGYYTPWQ
jgi:membrane peptidoglycan carboxypeptidase